MKIEKPSAGDRAPFLLVGALCWLCAAVVVGVAAAVLLGWVPALVAVLVVTGFVLSISWSLSSSASFGHGRKT